MTQRILIALFIVAAFLASPLATPAQIPGGVQVPQVPSTGSLPTGALSKDSLLQQAPLCLVMRNNCSFTLR